MKEPCYICNGKGTWTTYETLRPLESDCPDCMGTGYELDEDGTTMERYRFGLVKSRHNVNPTNISHNDVQWLLEQVETAQHLKNEEKRLHAQSELLQELRTKVQQIETEKEELREQIEILRIEKEQMKNDSLFHRKKADEYLRKLNVDEDGGRTLQDWLR